MKTEAAENLCNNLQTAAGRKLTSEVNQAESYHYGYIQACEDFIAGIRQENDEWQQGRRPTGIERSRSEAADADFIVGNCPKCGELVAVAENYCKNCGTKLDWSHERNK